MNVYETGTVTIGGRPICKVQRVTVAEAFRDLESEPRARFTSDRYDSVTFCADDGTLNAIARTPPAHATGEVSISLPWGILETITVRGEVDFGGADVSAERVAMTGEIPEPEIRRAVSMAVERAIVDRKSRALVALQAWKADTNHAIQPMGLALLLRAYRGERKQRKAMRRLLRAAGITTGGAR